MEYVKKFELKWCSLPPSQVHGPEGSNLKQLISNGNTLLLSYHSYLTSVICCAHCSGALTTSGIKCIFELTAATIHLYKSNNKS